MLTEQKSRLSSAFLVLVVMTGWIGAPLVHEVEHALERAEMTHVHDVRDGVTLRTGCNPVQSLADDCPISLAKVQAISLGRPPLLGPSLSRVKWHIPTEAVFGRSLAYNFVRGPPAVA